ncbi:superinfection immunity protein [Mucilaginibacter litoreus]|uniref:Superinfection immunity protein n=1 Tax=Mucilaginibacter litoreus TaxID=1048221 RepID=A0ABW3AUU1_9SPHI
MFIIAIVCVVVYFIPTLLGRNKKCANSILLLNIFFGWTIIGWFAALIWARYGEASSKVSFSEDGVQLNVDSALSKLQKLDRLIAMHKHGVLNDEELELEKRKIL